jgi:protein ImuB
MFWIALQLSPDDDTTTWGWRALQFSPRVAFVDEALLLEVEASERLFGGRRKLVRALLAGQPGLTVLHWAHGATAHLALGRLRCLAAGEPLPDDGIAGMPLAALSAAREHLSTLERIGCTRWGQLDALPRAGVSRRFGAGLLAALDCAYGRRPERFDWITLPASFDQRLELPSTATTAAELMGAAHRLMSQLQAWLQARNLGVLAVELEWTLDLRRLDGKILPPTESLELRTAEPTQDMAHLRRLGAEQLARTPLAAPANQLRLRSVQTVPWGGVTTSLLPEEVRPGEKLHQLVERLSARLGESRVCMLEQLQDHRPEKMQRWKPARQLKPRESSGQPQDPVFPAWLLREPLRLQVKGDKPWYQGPLTLLTRARRIEAAWWDAGQAQPVLRDYFIARSESAGLLWIFRERLSADQERAPWFLHGLYA